MVHQTPTSSSELNLDVLMHSLPWNQGTRSWSWGRSWAFFPLDSPMSTVPRLLGGTGLLVHAGSLAPPSFLHSHPSPWEFQSLFELRLSNLQLLLCITSQMSPACACITLLHKVLEEKAGGRIFLFLTESFTALRMSCCLSSPWDVSLHPSQLPSLLSLARVLEL